MSFISLSVWLRPVDASGFERRSGYAALARATVSGSGELLRQSDLPVASTLRENVTSPGGTTEAALQVLMGDPGLAKASWSMRLRRQIKRAKELGA